MVTSDVAFNVFAETCGVIWDKAVARLVTDSDAVPTFHGYPAGHCKHIRTSGPNKSTFATVRHRMRGTKGSLSRETGLAMPFRLMMPPQKTRRRRHGA